MGDPSETAKAAKKAAKAQAKLDKKLAKKGAGDPRAHAASTASSGGSGDAGLSPAERSAKAAERQATLHQYRVWISLVIALLALVSLLVTLKPWTLFDGTDRSPAASSPAIDHPD